MQYILKQLTKLNPNNNLLTQPNLNFFVACEFK